MSVATPGDPGVATDILRRAGRADDVTDDQGKLLSRQVKALFQSPATRSASPLGRVPPGEVNVAEALQEARPTAGTCRNGWRSLVGAHRWRTSATH